MKLIFTAGGTGGHIYPALSIAEEIMNLKPDTEILFITGIKEIERKIISGAGYRMKTLPVIGMPRKLSGAFAGFLLKLGISVLKSMSIISDYKPAAVVATGGYVSGPPVIAAKIKGVPIFIQEQNSYPGITTKKLAGNAKKVFLGFSEAQKYFGKSVKTMVTGNPVRGIIGTGNRQESAKYFGLSPEIKTVLVFGGSQGARAINKAMAGAVNNISGAGIQVIWQTGTAEYEQYEKYGNEKVKVLPYIDDMSMAYACSDLVVSRAGAMTIAEITACGLPAVFIPLPTSAENHQEFNAKALLKAGAAVMIPERNLTPELLFNEIRNIMHFEEKHSLMASASNKIGEKDAAGIIAATILKEIGDK